MIVRYRKREVDRQAHIEFDWKEGRVVLKNLRYFPQWNRVYRGKAQNWRTKHYYTLYDIEPECINEILTECIKQFGNGAVEVPARPLTKMAFYAPAFGHKWVEYEHYKELIEKNLVHWKADGLLITER